MLCTCLLPGYIRVGCNHYMTQTAITRSQQARVTWGTVSTKMWDMIRAFTCAFLMLSNNAALLNTFTTRCVHGRNTVQSCIFAPICICFMPQQFFVDIAWQFLIKGGTCLRALKNHSSNLVLWWHYEYFVFESCTQTPVYFISGIIINYLRTKTI